MKVNIFMKFSQLENNWLFSLPKMVRAHISN